jgi:hypothetical protein
MSINIAQLFVNGNSQNSNRSQQIKWFIDTIFYKTCLLRKKNCCEERDEKLSQLVDFQIWYELSLGFSIPVKYKYCTGPSPSLLFNGLPFTKISISARSLHDTNYTETIVRMLNRSRFRLCVNVRSFYPNVYYSLKGRSIRTIIAGDFI